MACTPSAQQPSPDLAESANSRQTTSNEHETVPLTLEIEFLKTSRAISGEDIRKLIVDRKSFVEQIQTGDISFGQFLDHIKEESYLLDLCDAEINEHNMRDIRENTQGNILTVLSNRINHLYFCMFRLFPVDEPTLLSFMKFFLNYKQHITKSSNLLTEILSKEHSDPEVYISAAKFLYDNTSDINAARQHIAIGLKYHSSYPNLYLSDFWFETQLLQNNDGQSLPIAMRVYKNIFKMFGGDLSFHIKLLNCTKRFNKCEELLFHVINDMVEMHGTNELMWKKLANMYLDGFIFDRKRKCLHYDQHCKRRLETCMNAYEDGLKQVPQESRILLWDLYIEQVIELWKEYGLKNESLRIFLNKEMDQIFVRAHENGMLSKPHHYLYWALHSDKGPSSILTKAILLNNDNPTIWADLLNIYAVNDNHNMVKKVFKDGLFSLGNQYLAWPLWESMCSYIKKKDLKSVILFYQHEINRTCPKISMRLQYNYLLWTKHIRGLGAARRLFSDMKNTKPTSLKLFKCMIKLERSTNKPNKTFISRLYAESCKKFGQGNLKLWKESIEFTYMCGMHTEAKEIFKSSYSLLETELVEKLKNEFELIKDEFARLHLIIDPNVIKINDDNDSPPDNPVKNNCPSTANCTSTLTDNCPSTSTDNCLPESTDNCSPISTDKCPPSPTENFPSMFSINKNKTFL